MDGLCLPHLSVGGVPYGGEVLTVAQIPDEELERWERETGEHRDNYPLDSAEYWSLSQDGASETHLGMATPKLTRLQEDVLLVVQENGPVTPRDVAYHLPIGEASARGVLTRLEAKNLVAATYTGHHRGTGRAYVAR